MHIYADQSLEDPRARRPRHPFPAFTPSSRAGPQKSPFYMNPSGNILVRGLEKVWTHPLLSTNPVSCVSSEGRTRNGSTALRPAPLDPRLTLTLETETGGTDYPTRQSMEGS